MSAFKLLKSVSLAEFKNQNNVNTLDIFESKAGNRYIVVDGEAIMFAKDFDGSKPVVVVTVENTEDATQFSFIGNETRKVVGTL